MERHLKNASPHLSSPQDKDTSPATEEVKKPAKCVKKPVALASDAECQTPWPCPGIQQPQMVEFMSGLEVSGNAWTHMSFSGVQTASKSTETDHIQTKTVGTCTEPTVFSYARRVLNSNRTCRDVCGVELPFFRQTMTSLEGKFHNKKLSEEDQLVLYFMKLKSAATFRNIASIFGIHYITASKIFTAVLKAHYEVAKDSIWWLTREEVQETMPDSFKLHYPDTRVIIDASEIKIQCPCSVDACVLCYSTYKSSHTCKFLVGIAPCGLVTFMSRAWGGRVTDCHITNESGILNLLEPGDGVMADKGFPHIKEDILGRGGFLIMPPFFTKDHHGQFREGENKECYKIASVRIHVERAIRRLKTFGVFRFLDHSLYKHINRILIVIAFCINNFGPLIKDAKEDTVEDIGNADDNADIDVVDDQVQVQVQDQDHAHDQDQEEEEQCEECHFDVRLLEDDFDDTISDCDYDNYDNYDNGEDVDDDDDDINFITE
jgi:hypothetical protein